MATAVRVFHVKATAEQVWDYLQTPANIAGWWPNCVEIKDEKRANNGRYQFIWTDRGAGVTCRGEIEEVVQEPGERLTLHIAGDLCGDFTWRVKRESGGVEVIFESDYDLPIRMLLPYLPPVRILMYQQHEAEAIVAGVRERFNGQ